VTTADSWKLLVFRDGQRKRASRELLGGLLKQIESVESLSDFASQFARDELIDALLRAGELECAVADQQGCHRQAGALSRITDALAQALVHGSRPRLEAALSEFGRDSIPATLTVSTPEGFCYYALHPLDYVDLLNEHQIEAQQAAVIGIRSIGTTLSAVVRAWFHGRGVSATRMTVRPSGHPFDRELLFHHEQRQWVSEQLEAAAQFFVVDEGPGLSGSSFLSVAEALVEAGVPPRQIVLLPSSNPDFSKLLARNAAARWNRFRTLSLKPTRRLPADAGASVGGGEWRRRVFASQSEWPPVWGWTERQKHLSTDGKLIFRFDGHGRYGREVRRRSEIVAIHGWGPRVAAAGEGFSVSPWLEGMRPREVDRNILIQLARYCAFRAQHFSCDPVPQSDLSHMAQVNLDRSLGISRRMELPLERPVIADARMMPHEWLLSQQNHLIKFDASSHGDDHFYPGSTDIAWDVAGAIVEWKLQKPDADLLVDEYWRVSGDRVAIRLENYLLAYAVFRMALCLSAAISLGPGMEKAGFEAAAAGYKTFLGPRAAA